MSHTGRNKGSEASIDTLHIATELRRNLDFVRTDRGKYADLILTFTYVQQCDDHQHHNEQRHRELRQVIERYQAGFVILHFSESKTRHERGIR